MNGLIALAALALAQAPLASAQNGPASPPPSASEIDSARAEADRLIAEADAGDLFINVTTGSSARVRHTRSGLVCTFRPGDEGNRILIFEQGASIPRGDDVGCNGGLGDFAHTIYATRYRPAASARDALAGAAAAIKQRWSGATWFDGDVAEATIDRGDRSPLPQTLLAHYIVTIDGTEHYTSARVVEHDGWILKQRLTAPREEMLEAQVAAAALWVLVLADVIDRGQPV